VLGNAPPAARSTVRRANLSRAHGRTCAPSDPLPWAMLRVGAMPRPTPTGAVAAWVVACVAAADHRCIGRVAVAAVADVAVVDGGASTYESSEGNTMIIHRTVASAALAVGLLLIPALVGVPAFGQETSLDQYIGAKAEEFADPSAATEALKARLAANDFEGVARLLGLDPMKVGKVENINDTFGSIRDRAAKLFSVQEDGEQRIVMLGDEVWPFPFPVRKTSEGKWAFNTEAGIEEIINRRIGENELEAIKTMRSYVDGQTDYASDDRDDDGVLEFAQKLISSEGKTDGLYWPSDQGDGDSPAGEFVSEQQLSKAKAGDGYFGYRFRILTGQGNNVAGGRYDYVINGNMIAGFGLIAWPVKYAETGVETFVVNQARIVYQRDLGPNTEALAKGIVRFNPDKRWEIVNDVTD